MNRILYLSLYLVHFLLSSPHWAHSQSAEPTAEAAAKSVNLSLEGLANVSRRIALFDYELSLSDGCTLNLDGRTGAIRFSGEALDVSSSLKSAGLKVRLDALYDENQKLLGLPLFRYTVHPAQGSEPMALELRFGCDTCVEQAKIPHHKMPHFTSCYRPTNGLVVGGGVCDAEETDTFLLFTQSNEAILPRDLEETSVLLNRVGKALHYLIDTKAEECRPKPQENDPLASFFDNGNEAGLPAKAFDIAQFENWFGYNVVLRHGGSEYFTVRFFKNGRALYRHEYHDNEFKWGTYTRNGSGVCVEFEGWEYDKCFAIIPLIDGAYIYVLQKGYFSQKVDYLTFPDDEQNNLATSRINPTTWFGSRIIFNFSRETEFPSIASQNADISFLENGRFEMDARGSSSNPNFEAWGEYELRKSQFCLFPQEIEGPSEFDWAGCYNLSGGDFQSANEAKAITVTALDQVWAIRADAQLRLDPDIEKRYEFESFSPATWRNVAFELKARQGRNSHFLVLMDEGNKAILTDIFSGTFVSGKFNRSQRGGICVQLDDGTGFCITTNDEGHPIFDFVSNGLELKRVSHGYDFTDNLPFRAKRR